MIRLSPRGVALKLCTLKTIDERAQEATESLGDPGVFSRRRKGNRVMTRSRNQSATWQLEPTCESPA